MKRQGMILQMKYKESMKKLEKTQVAAAPLVIRKQL